MDVKEVENGLQILYDEYATKEQELIDKLPKKERIKIGRPIKEISHLDEFQANGQKYVIRTSLTVSRFEEFEKLQIRVGYGVDFRGLFDNLIKTYGYMNQGKVADASVMVHNIMNGVKDNIEERENEVLLLCALFICRESEDLALFDESLSKAKIADWRKEGIAMESFFTLAFSLVNGFIPVLNQVSADISENLEAVQKRIDESRTSKAEKS